MDDKEHIKLKDFLAWVRVRRAYSKDASVDDETLDFVAQGVERFLSGEKNPWPKKRGNKRAPEKVWECYHLAATAKGDAKFLPQHKEPGGAFYIVGEKLSCSPSTVESHVRQALRLLETYEGKMEYAAWLRKEKGCTRVDFYPKDSPEALAEKARRELMAEQIKAK